MFARYQENFNSGTNKFKFICQFKKSQDLGNISTFLGVTLDCIIQGSRIDCCFHHKENQENTFK